MCKIPFSIDKPGGGYSFDTTRILEKVITTIIAALIIGVGSWYIVFQDMRMDQEIIKNDMLNHILVTDKRHIEFVAHNTEDHKRIMSDSKIMYSHVMDEMKEISHEMREMRKDLYTPASGRGK